MQKAQKVVTSLAILFLITINSCLSQTKSDDYQLLKKVIEMNSISKDSIFLLQKSNDFNQEQLHKYYRHHVLKEKGVIGIIGGKVNKDGKIVRDDYTPEVQDDFQEAWYAIYRPVDSIFSIKEIELLATKEETSFWDEKQLGNKVQLIDLDSLVKEARKGDYTGVNYFQSYKISKPFYANNKKYAIVQYRKYAKPPSYLYIFEKQKEEWVIIETIKEHF
ncbi:hypothetical protein UMM65_10705 [Aureibaculum sp. 2210JD6-5]|uniref:hypothetical protein n=1 Tax=Aureibaculum sp. 2210JD6-5 TaxID=3103957 RepID=UPI002AAE38F7|nr:hypothetical protein [Aureibaculum sp. 2210JD6-5]MDY7395714.1 hypothetical protein [Aureibaculum sp. 2210JD6-5]